MIFGETVSVSFRDFGPVDAFGNGEITYTEPVEYDDILVGRGSTVDVITDGQLVAIKADKRFCFPRGFDRDLRGALITRGGVTYKVVGDPSPITDANIPPSIRWNIRAEAVIYDG